MLLAGVVLILSTVGSVLWSVSRTPENLRGFYGFFYTIVSMSGFIGGIALIVFSRIA